MSLRIASTGSESQQVAYRQSVEGMIQNIRRTRTGRIVLHFIEISPQTVTIVPYTDGDMNAEAVPGFEGSSGTFSSDSTARGSGSRVRFGVDASTVTGDQRPGGHPDEVLLHELAHAVRQISGAERYSRTPDGEMILLPIPYFENVEEFFAVMIVSIYSSELGRPIVGNHGYRRLRDPDMLQRRPFLTRLSQMWRRMPVFVAEIAAIPADVAAFNPFRDVPH